MDIFEAEVEDRQVIVLYDGPNRPCLLYVRLLRPFDMVVDYDVLPNPVTLSASLRSHLSYTGACHFLHANKVGAESPLWHLNYDGYSPPALGSAA